MRTLFLCPLLTPGYRKNSVMHWIVQRLYRILKNPAPAPLGYCHLVNVVTTSLKGHSTILSSHVPRMSREEDIECLSTGKTRKLQMGCFWLSYGQEWRKSFLANQRGLEQG